MGIENPIIIIGIPRSGTSMVAGIFAKHGVFFGNCRPADKYNPKGYYENITISNLIRNREMIDKYKITDILKNEGYNGGPWAVKHSIGAIKYWEKDIKPKIIHCKRPINPTFQSYKKFFSINFNNFKYFYNNCDRLAKSLDSITVQTDAIVKGNYSSLIKAFKYCNLEFDKKIVDSFIETKYWHYD